MPESMPGRKTHSAVTILVSSAVPVISWQLGYQSDAIVGMTIGSLSALMLHPDLDLANNSKGIWARLWWPYGKFVKHRSWISHFPVISTAIRLAYFTFMAFLVFGTASMLPYVDISVHWSDFWVWCFIGLCIADCAHILLDYITTTIKRSF